VGLLDEELPCVSNGGEVAEVGLVEEEEADIVVAGLVCVIVEELGLVSRWFEVYSSGYILHLLASQHC
jgi:hypothetical protein